MYLIKMILLLISQGSRPLLPIDWRNLPILRQHIWSLTNRMLLWIISKAPAASQSTVIIRQLYFRSDLLHLQKQKLSVYFLHLTEGILIFFASKPLKHLKTCQVPVLGILIYLFLSTFGNLSRDPVPLGRGDFWTVVYEIYFI
jgi:hypothetical protein